MKKIFLLLALFTALFINAQTPTGTTSAGKFKSYIPALGTVHDSCVVWNGTSKEFKYLPLSEINPNLQEVLTEGNTSTLGINVASVYAGSSSIDATAIGQYDSTTKGLLPPRMTTVQFNAIASKANGLMYYDTTKNLFGYYDTTQGTLSFVPNYWSLGANSMEFWPTYIIIDNGTSSTSTFTSEGVFCVDQTTANTLSLRPCEIVYEETTVGSTKFTFGATTGDTNVNFRNLGNTTEDVAYLSDITGGSGTVTNFSFTNANGITGSVTNPTTTPTLVLSLGAITPTTIVASSTISATNFSGSSSGANTGDQTSIVGVTGTMAQYDTSVTDGNFVYQSQALGTPSSGNLVNCTFPTLNQNTTGSAAIVTTTINTGVTATTQTAGDNSTKVATTAYIDRKLNRPVSTSNILLTGVTTPTVVASLLIPANTYVSGDTMEIFVTARKSTTAGAVLFNVYHDTTLNGTSNTIASAVSTTTTNRTVTFNRYLTFDGTTLNNSNAATSALYTPFGAASASPSSTTCDPTVNNYITFEISGLTVVSESATILKAIVRPLKL